MTCHGEGRGRRARTGARVEGVRMSVGVGVGEGASADVNADMSVGTRLMREGRRPYADPGAACCVLSRSASQLDRRAHSCGRLVVRGLQPKTGLLGSLATLLRVVMLAR